MASTTSVRVEGLRELGLAMQELSRDIALRVAGQATNAGAQLIKKRAKQNIERSPSVQTRSLLNAVIVKKIPRSQSQYTSEHIVTVRGRGKKTKRKLKTQQSVAPHAHFVEFGTIHMKKEPFLGPAFDVEKGRAVDAIADRLRKRIEAVKPK